MTTAAFAPASAVRRLTTLVAALVLTLVAIIAPITASWAKDTTATPGACQAASVVTQYANGQIPVSALCTLLGTTDEFLRADAAYNFNRLSKAYAKRFGTPICITDSYRTLTSQVSLYRSKPKLAAKPGTSNHGWGVAADLCGGIGDFGSVQHTWLFENAPRYRWVHPTWAQETGSRPEPWHWEFAPRANMVRDALGLPRLSGGYNGFQVAFDTEKKNVTTKKVTSAAVKASGYAAAHGLELSPVDDV